MEQMDESEASLQEGYTQAAFTKLYLNLHCTTAVKDRDIVMTSPQQVRKQHVRHTEESSTLSHGHCLERGAALQGLVSRIESSGSVRLMLSAVQEGSVDTGTGTVQPSSGSGSKKRNKRRGMVKKDASLMTKDTDVTVISPEDDSMPLGESPVDVESVVKRFDPDNYQHVKEFVTHGGLTLCRLALDTQIGCLSSAAAFQEATAGIATDRFVTLNVLCRVLRRLAQDYDTQSSDLLTRDGDTTNIENPLEEVLLSGACIGVADIVQYLLHSFQIWGNSHLPKVLSSRSHKSHSKNSSKKPSASGSSCSKSTGKKKAKPTVRAADGSFVGSVGSPAISGGSASLYGVPAVGVPSSNRSLTSEQQAIDIKWPSHIATLLPSLLLVLSRLCKVCSRQVQVDGEGSTQKGIAYVADPRRVVAQHWMSYVHSSGLVECVSGAIRDVQCIAASCCTDRVVFELLAELSSFVGNYFTLLR